MANRLKQIEKIKQGISITNDHIVNKDWDQAITVQAALIDQLLRVVEGDVVDYQSNSDKFYTFTVDSTDE